MPKKLNAVDPLKKPATVGDLKALVNALGPLVRESVREEVRDAVKPAQHACIGDADVKAMVDRFLGWKLPANFAPDGGVTFTPSREPSDPFWPVGTNLLTAIQAEAMIRHMIAGLTVRR